MKYKNILYSTLSGLLLFASCAQTHENAEQVDHLPNMYPDYADVTIPVNIAPLNFEIRDKHLSNIETTLSIEGADEDDAENTLTATSNSQNLQFDLKEWKNFLEKAAGKNIKVQIYSKSNEGKWTAFSRPPLWRQRLRIVLLFLPKPQGNAPSRRLLLFSINLWQGSRRGSLLPSPRIR